MTHKKLTLKPNPCMCGGSMTFKSHYDGKHHQLTFIGCDRCDVALLQHEQINDETIGQWNALFPLRPSGATVEIVTTAGEPVAYAMLNGSIINGYARVVAYHNVGTKLMFRDGDRCWPADVVLKARL